MADLLDKEIRNGFKAWCARHGLRSVRSAYQVGEARVLCRKGLYSIEVIVPESAEALALRQRGALPGQTVEPGCGYSYPLLDKVSSLALAFVEKD